MPTQVLRPNETISGSTLYTITGGSASINAALADDADGTYVQKTGTGVASVVVGFGTYSIGASERVRQVRLRARVAGATINSKANIYLGTTGAGVSSTYGAAFSVVRGAQTLSTVVGPWAGTTPDGNTWTQAKIDALRIQFEEYKNTTDRSSLYELFVDVDLTTKPTVSVSGPTGTITTTATPDVAWTYSDTDGDGQTAYQIKVFTAAQYGAGGFDPTLSTAAFDSGTVSTGDTTATLTGFLNATGAHRAYVRVAKTINGSLFFSDWAFSAFTMSLTAPTTPTLTATWDEGLGRTQVVVVGAAATGYDYQVFNIERSDDGGASWGFVRNGEGYAVGASFTSTIQDYEAPRGITVQYRARAVAYLGSNVVVSGYSTIDSEYVTNDLQWWFKSVSTPALNVGGVKVLEGVGLTVEEDLGVFRAIGRQEPLVVSGTIGGQDGSYTAVANGTQEWVSLYALATQQSTLLIQDPFGEQKYVRVTSRSWKQTGATSSPRREITMGYVEVSGE